LRKYIITFLILLIATSAWGAITVGTPVVAHDNVLGDGTVLPIPRWKAGIDSDGSNLAIVPARTSTGGDYFAWIYSNDYGASWDTVYSTHSVDGSGALDYHVSSWVHNDTLYIAGPNTTDDAFFRYIASPYSAIGDMGTLRVVDDLAFAVKAMVVANDDSTWVVSRRHSSFDSLRVYISDDKFASDNTLQYLVMENENRFGMFLDTDSNIPILFVLEYTDGFYYYKWNGSVFDAPSDSMVYSGSPGGAQRAFTVNWCDGRIHLIRSDGDASNQYLIHHVQDPSDSVGWSAPDTISTATTLTDGLGYSPQSCVKGDSLFLFYSTVGGGDTFCYKMWTPSGWTADSVVITDTTTVDQWLNTVPYVSADVDYIPFYWVTDENVMWFNKLELDITQCQTDSAAADTVIYSLPFTITTDMIGFTIRAACDSVFNSSTNILVINSGVHDVLVNFGTDSIYWNQGDNVSQDGIAFSNTYNIELRGGYFFEDVTLSNSSAIASDFMSIGQGHDITIDSMYIQIKGHSSQIWVDEGGGNYTDSTHNIYFYECIFDNQRTAQDNRDQWIEMSMIATGNHDLTGNGTTVWDGFEYHYRISNCSTAASNWNNLYFNGDSSVIIVDSNYLFLDANNTSTITCDLVHCSAEQCYAVSFRGGDDRGCIIKMFDNVIRTGTTYAGGDGVFITAMGQDTTSGSTVEIYDNDFLCRKGNAGFGGGGYETSTVIKMRGGSSGGRGIYGINIHDNLIVAYADSDATTSYMTVNLNGIRIEEDTTTTYGTSRIVIRNNRIFTGWSGTARAPNGTVYMAGLEMSGIDSAVAKHYVIENNYFSSGCYALGWGGDNADPEMIRQMTFRADSFYVHDSAMSNPVFLLLQTPDADDHNMNTFIDCVFDTTGNMDFNDQQNSEVAHSFWVKNTFTMQVLQSGSPLQSAACSLWNGYSQLVGSGVSDANGQYSNEVTYHFDSDTGDSTGFNDHILHAWSGSDSSFATYTIEYNDKLDTLVLGAGVGGSSGKLTPIFR